MPPAPDPKSVTPQPGLPRTIGVLNLIFGTFLFLCGLGCLNQFGPSLLENQPMRFDPEEAQAFSEEIRRNVISELRDREAAAEEEPEKARLKKERLALEGTQPKIAEQIDLKSANRDLLWVSWYLWADVTTGPVLNLLMLAAGIGLMQLRGWARSLAVWVAALKLARLAILSVLLIAVVVPRAMHLAESFFATDVGKATLVQAIERQNANRGGAAVPISPRDFVEVLKAFGNISTILFLGFGAIFPALTLVVLTRPAARAACVAAEVEDDEN